jgi:elongation factor 1-gamma
MVVSGTLFTYADSFRGKKVSIAAQYAGADVKVVEVNANDKSNKHVPNFVSTDKKVKLFEDVAIAYYVASDEMRGKTVEERATVLQWLAYGSNELQSAVASVVYPALSLVAHDHVDSAHAQADLNDQLTFIDAHLKTRTYLASERITLADIAVAMDVSLAFQHVVDATQRGRYVNLMRWWNTIVNQENVKKVTGEIKLCTKAVTHCPTKWAENKAKQQSKPAAENKQDKPKAEPKKAEAKKPEPKPAAADEDEDESFDDGPKNDPFAAMPKGAFNMDEFKRTYSNEDTHKVALPYLWKNFEKDFYSMWMCEYKYPEELQQTFMTCNLIGGMFQRIERLRKNAFGSMCVWGENNNNTIAGVWFWKGQELCFPLCPDWTTDYESYTWRKMNIDDEKDRAIITKMFAWEGEHGNPPKKFNSGKIFK